MKRPALTLVLVLAITLSAVAQKRGEHKPDPKRMTDRMKTELSLSDEQYNPVYEANKTMILKMEEAGGREASKEEVTEIRQAYFSELKQVLNEEQLQIVRENQAERHRRRKERHKEPE